MKTIEEAAKEYAKNLSSAEVFSEQHAKDFKAGVKFAKRWIPVEEELPKVGDKKSYILYKINESQIRLTKIRDKYDIDYLKMIAICWRPIELR